MEHMETNKNAELENKLNPMHFLGVNDQLAATFSICLFGLLYWKPTGFHHWNWGYLRLSLNFWNMVWQWLIWMVHLGPMTFLGLKNFRVQELLSSGNQAWQWKSTIYTVVDFPTQISIFRGFPIATCGYLRIPENITIWTSKRARLWAAQCGNIKLGLRTGYPHFKMNNLLAWLRAWRRGKMTNPNRIVLVI